MNIGSIVRNASNVMKHNSPTILTAVGVGGVLTTAILAARGAFKASEKLREYESTKNDKDASVLSFKDTFLATWTCYIPSAAMGGVTIACIIGANAINTRRTAALLSAYTLTDSAFTEYREKTEKVIGAAKEQKIRDEIAQDHVNSNPPDSQIVVVGDQDIVCLESLTGRYFHSNMEKLRKTQNDINQVILNGMGYFLANDLYERLGLRPVAQGDEIGWNSDKTLEFDFSSVLDEKGNPVLVVGYRRGPFPHPYGVWSS